jgi:hypothetical protein
MIDRAFQVVIPNILTMATLLRPKKSNRRKGRRLAGSDLQIRWDRFSFFWGDIECSCNFYLKNNTRNSVM